VSGANYQVQHSVSREVAASLTPLLHGNPARSGAEPSLSEKLDMLRAGRALAVDPEPGKDRLDIRQAARLQLQLLGINPERIASCPLCTVAEPELFHSWRRDGVKAVQWSGIVAQS
jgi:copper oxidase (laccase) domain-containing protein